MKKFFIIIGLLFGIIGNSFAVCELTESTDRTPSDEDLYPQNPDDSRMALICEKGKCEDGEIVYATGTHYLGNMFNTSGFNEFSGDRFYKCKHGRNDRWENVNMGFGNVSNGCGGFRSSWIDLGYNDKGVVRGIRHGDNKLFTNLCVEKYEEICGKKCNQTNFGKFIFCENGFRVCTTDGRWSYSVVANGGICSYDNPENVASYSFYARVGGDYMAEYYDRGFENGQLLTDEDRNSICVGCDKESFYTGYYYPSDGLPLCTDNVDYAWCKWRSREKNTEWTDDDVCKCLDDGMEWDNEKHDCIKETSGGSGGGSSDSSSDDGSTGEKNTCEELHPNASAERLACCRAGNITKWTGTETSGTCSCVDTNKQWKYTTGARTGQCVAKSVPDKTCAQLYPGNAEAIACCEFGKNGGAEWKNNKCVCNGKNKKWEYPVAGKSGRCIDNGKTPPNQPKDNKINCVVKIGTSVRCKNGDNFNQSATFSIDAEKCNLYKSNVSKYLNEIAATLCESSGGVEDILTDNQVKDAAANIDKFFEYAKSNANVWKNADGKFNTARLASDATAGVILGTVGGIVSAKIIKKKQIEKGFDALQCTIGGQTVADWDDEFRVGLGR
jgi:hypothetical protein